MNRSLEDQKVANEMFDKFRDDLLKRELSNSESYDKAILALSSASLGFSLTVIKFIVPVDTSIHIWLLILCWSLLVLSVTLSLSAYLISNKAIQTQLNNARDYYKNGIEDAFTRKNIYASINTFLNQITGFLLAIAITIIVVFISINITNGENEMSKEKSSGTCIEKSANIPSMEQVSTPVDSATNSANVPTMEQAPNTGTTSKGGSSSEGKK
ncbi:hypothetical protein IMCC21906_02596 [Spongiibacter sp. IMCC21906]|uniref:hypothetical protein n=1 Tax=Spongiibacter sp. IMCC21906 TaxID=1620392 RepID=UPI00062E02B0|nr:hypothetical protein [Spongiibacter sp. IMCC21906]AKH70241.1 hypothetical protein IMCC21906_02596 [Spongiibacter sp. IMCC21906]